MTLFVGDNVLIVAGKDKEWNSERNPPNLNREGVVESISSTGIVTVKFGPGIFSPVAYYSNNVTLLKQEPDPIEEMFS